MDLGLKGKFGVVTGASAGIGRGIARYLSGEGLELGLVARRADKLERLRSELRELHGMDHVVLPADLTAPDAPEAIVDGLRAHGRAVDVLIHSAGKSSYWFRPFAEGKEHLVEPTAVTPESWRESFEINFFQQRRLTELLLPSMIERGFGRIVFVNSVFEPEFMSVGLPAKAAVTAWAKGLSREVAAHNVTINLVPVGRIESEQMDNLVAPTQSIRDRTVSEIPAGRLGTAEDVARVVAFLSATDNEYVTGQALIVDGGRSKFAF